MACLAKLNIQTTTDDNYSIDYRIIGLENIAKFKEKYIPQARNFTRKIPHPTPHLSYQLLKDQLEKLIERVYFNISYSRSCLENYQTKILEESILSSCFYKVKIFLQSNFLRTP